MINAIDISALGKQYKGVAALAGVSATVPMGKVVGLLGHNGAGKSTLIKLILGLIAPTSGHVEVLGQSPWGSNAVSLRRRIGYLPESVAFYGNLTGNEVINYLASLKRASREQASKLLERVGIAYARDRRVSTYSKGMRQRLGLAQALLATPELVVLDEPTGGLDPQATRELYDIVGELRAEGHSVLVSSHVLAELEPHIDSALILRQGQLLAAGSVGDLRRQSGLPDIVVVQLKDAADPVAFARGLDTFALTHDVRFDGLFEIQIAEGGKLALLQRLVTDPAVEDIVVKEASLARLYDYLGAGTKQQGKQKP
ncbi:MULTISPECIES: ABC transporter ATP-binding protein [unclassified Rhodanobacter]|uniref:ABC transporter ATP-binding protein n=1 Tax=unclassified Rhodanobacter TaxID=2621553 RepID=UPI00098620F4|nr:MULTISPECIES: ABC transporter ATP-binding protein [unclassified Rhodanobacter]OOG38568.1 copper ABC transporter ATP-binding protein [Rhodanobacter sp. C05]OOG50093.1 copper ABC transporter ATP-binding protein [Rhodanobacter sp. C01]OOG52281.1 copper ABC transporter ATP-binding protein [Rhodanobacter sp. C03]